MRKGIPGRDAGASMGGTMPEAPRPTLIQGGPAYFTPEGYRPPMQPQQAFMPTDTMGDPIGDMFRRQLPPVRGPSLPRLPPQKDPRDGQIFVPPPIDDPRMEPMPEPMPVIDPGLIANPAPTPPEMGGGTVDMMVIVYGPDGKMYSSPGAARRAGVTDFSMTNPNSKPFPQEAIDAFKPPQDNQLPQPPIPPMAPPMMPPVNIDRPMIRGLEDREIVNDFMSIERMNEPRDEFIPRMPNENPVPFIPPVEMPRDMPPIMPPSFERIEEDPRMPLEEPIAMPRNPEMVAEIQRRMAPPPMMPELPEIIPEPIPMQPRMPMPAPIAAPIPRRDPMPMAPVELPRIELPRINRQIPMMPMMGGRGRR